MAVANSRQVWACMYTFLFYCVLLLVELLPSAERALYFRVGCMLRRHSGKYFPIKEIFCLFSQFFLPLSAFTISHWFGYCSTYVFFYLKKYYDYWPFSVAFCGRTMVISSITDSMFSLFLIKYQSVFKLFFKPLQSRSFFFFFPLRLQVHLYKLIETKKDLENSISLSTHEKKTLFRRWEIFFAHFRNYLQGIFFRASEKKIHIQG